MLCELNLDEAELSIASCQDLARSGHMPRGRMLTLRCAFSVRRMSDVQALSHLEAEADLSIIIGLPPVDVAGSSSGCRYC